MLYKEQINPQKIPTHIAIIMDGNGRWAKEKGKERSFGHQAGAETVHTIVETAARTDVKFLTLYTFSTENWKRPEKEITGLMSLLFNSIEEDLFMKNNVRFRTIGATNLLPIEVQERLNLCIEHTSVNTGMCLTLALSYSSTWELTEAAKQIALQAKEEKITIDQIDEQMLTTHLATNYMPNPDLLIRTGGEYRLSNYLLWQCAYTELYFCNTYWPDFKEEEFYKAIVDYQLRERRFGKTSEQL